MGVSVTDPPALVKPVAYSEVLSIDAFARRLGVTGPAVRQGIKVGRIVPPATAIVNGRVKVIDPGLAQTQWVASSKRPHRTADSMKGGPKEGPVRQPRSVAPAPAHATQPAIPSLSTQAARMRDEDGEPVAVTSRERKDAADASLAELKLAREKKEVLPEAEYRLAACALVANARARILGLPSRFAQRNPGAPAEQIALLDSLCREALTELETWDALEVPA